MIKQKKAQVTLFILIGLMILIASFLFYYMAGKRAETLEVGVGVTPETQTEIIPIMDYVEDCLNEIAIDAFKKIGEHGGYIDLRDPDLSGKGFNFNSDPTESDAAYLGDVSSNNIVYWWYMNAPNDVLDMTLDSKIPTLSEIEWQVDRYLVRELEGCVNDFKIFTDDGFEITYSSPTAVTKIGFDDVDIVLDYPLTIEKGNFKTSVSEFRINLDLRFREVFELAQRITIHEINYQFIENIFLHLISLYSYELNSQLIPPLGWLDHKKTTTSWSFQQVKDRLMAEVLPNLMLMQVNNTRNANRIDSADPSYQGVYDAMFLNLVNSTDFEYASVNFFYDPKWPIYFDITPKSGDLLNPNVHSQDYPLNLVPSSQTNFYEFFYDISAPLVVMIRDNHSLTEDGESGYTFMFALEGNIRDNKDLEDWSRGEGTIGTVDYSAVIAEYNQLDSDNGKCEGINERWICPFDTNIASDSAPACKLNCNNFDCNPEPTKWRCNQDNSVYDSEYLCMSNCVISSSNRISEDPSKTLLCDPPQRLSGDVVVSVVDKHTGLAIDDASISFICGNYGECSLGVTSSGNYEGKFPICIGDGRLKVEKEGYLTELYIGVSTELDKDDNLVVELVPLDEQKVNIVYINVTNLFRVAKYVNKEFNSMYSPILTVIDTLRALKWVKPNHCGTPFEIPDKCVVPEDRLNQTELDIVLTGIRQAESKLLTSHSLIESVTYWYRVNDNNVVPGSKGIKESLDMAYTYTFDLINTPDYIDNLIGRNFIQNFVIPVNTLSDIGNYISVFHEEFKNIQFWTDAELSNPARINNYRSNALSMPLHYDATVAVEKIKESPYEQNIPLPATFVTQGVVPTLKLVPGEYHVQITMSDNNGFTLPSVAGFIEYTPAHIGGLTLTNYSGYWEVSEADLNSASEIIFYVFKVDDPQEGEDLNELNNIENYSMKFRDFIEPEFLN